MTKKEELKLKRINKQKAKEERKEIVDSYIVKIKEVLDNEYFNMSIKLEDFNRELEQSAIKYTNIQIKIINILKDSEIEDIDIDTINELINEICVMEKANDDIYKSITAKTIKENKLLCHLPAIAEKIAKIVETITIDLKDDKNMEYIKSIVMNQSFDLLKYYNAYIIDIALESNSYIDLYIDSRETFLEFIDNSRKVIEEKINVSNNDMNITDYIKYQERLRVNYDELESFLKYKGFKQDRQCSTTHAIWKNVDGKTVPLPNKSGTIPQGTTSKILKQIGSSRNELATFLYS